VANILIITGKGMASVTNVYTKMKEVFVKEGHNVDIMFFDEPKKNRLIYDFAIYWCPFTEYFIRKLTLWFSKYVCKLMVCYTVIEGYVPHVRLRRHILRRHYIITPSQFCKRLIEEQGISVKEVIPHQLDTPLPVNHNYGKRWRSRFPKKKKILLYNGGSINRKGLMNLRRAIDILSKWRDDFIMVFHMDDVDWKWNTKVREVQGVNTVVEPEFGMLPLPQVYAKMFYSDVIVHPAKGEGFGLPIAEALALGKPLVCINAPAVNEIATPENSWMVMNVWPEELRWADNVVFKAVDYSPRDLALQINLCLDASEDEKTAKRMRGYQAVRRLKDTYKRFLKWVS